MSVSSRVLRKLKRDSDTTPNLAANGGIDSEDIDDSLLSSGVKKNLASANRFDLLNQCSNSESECKSQYEDDNAKSDEKSGVDNTNDRRSEEITKKKKKKKKKRALKAVRKRRNPVVEEVERLAMEINDSEYDYILPFSPELNAPVQLKKNVFEIDHKHLLVKNELKSVFGANAIEGEERAKRQSPRRKLGPLPIIEPKETWPPLNNSDIGITMSLVFQEEGSHMFSCKQSENYKAIANECMNATNSMNPANLMAVADRAPYHVDTLIQVAEAYKANDDSIMAAETIERALYGLESIFHPSFCLTKSYCQLPYIKEENRCVLLVIFKYMLSIGHKGCFRTALEFGKVVFNLDPRDDPLGVLFIIDFYALRAREFQWLVDFAEEMAEARRQFTLLPNMIFSKALALFELSDWRADNALQYALIMFPNVLLPMLKACNVEPDEKIRSFAYFHLPYNRRMKPMFVLCDLYVERTFQIWKDPIIIQWLRKNAFEVLARVERKDGVIQLYVENRTRRFEICFPRNLYRHVVLTDYKSNYPIKNEDNWFTFDPVTRTLITTYQSRPLLEEICEEDPSLFSLFFRHRVPYVYENDRSSDGEDDIEELVNNELAIVQLEDREPPRNENVPGNAEPNEQMRGLVGAMRNPPDEPNGENRNENPGDNEANLDNNAGEGAA